MKELLNNKIYKILETKYELLVGIFSTTLWISYANDDFSNYFDDGKEWWGTALWSIYGFNGILGRFIRTFKKEFHPLLKVSFFTYFCETICNSFS